MKTMKTTHNYGPIHCNAELISPTGARRIKADQMELDFTEYARGPECIRGELSPFFPAEVEPGEFRIRFQAIEEDVMVGVLDFADLTVHFWQDDPEERVMWTLRGAVIDSTYAPLDAGYPHEITGRYDGKFSKVVLIKDLRRSVSLRMSDWAEIADQVGYMKRYRPMPVNINAASRLLQQVALMKKGES